MKNKNRYEYGSPESVLARIVITTTLTLIMLPFLAISGGLKNTKETDAVNSQAPETTRTIRAIEPTRTIRAID